MHDATEEMRARLLTLMLDEIRYRTREGQVLAVTLEGPEPYVHSLRLQVAPVELASCPWPTVEGLVWRTLKPLSRFFGDCLNYVQAFKELQSWRPALVGFQLLDAALLADRCARQWGASPQATAGLAQLPAQWRDQFRECAASAGSAVALATLVVEDMLRAATSPSRAPGEAPFFYIVREATGELRIYRFSQQRALLRTESVAEWFARPAEAGAACAAARAGALAAQKARWVDSAERLLGTVSPRLVLMLQTSRLLKAPAGVCLAKAAVRKGIPPAHLGLVVNVSGGYASLRAARAHEAFVLGNHRGERFFFPPCQLVAELRRLSTSWQLCNPLVREPEGIGYHWVHPYTGELSDEGQRILWVDERPAEPMCELPPEANPGLLRFPVQRAGCARNRDICLKDQEINLLSLARKAKLNADTGCPDPAALLSGAWDLLRRGLTHGHRNNTGSPRVSFSSGSMPYPVLSGAAITGWLAERTFPYQLQPSLACEA